MPQKRAPLGSISDNRKPNTQLSSYLRGRIIQAFYDGWSRAKIARAFELPWSTVNDQIRLESSRLDSEVKPRPGRPPILQARLKRRLIRFINLNPFASYKRIRRELYIRASDQTIRRCLHQYGVRKWIAKKRPLITERTARLRYRWAKVHLNWPIEKWGKIMFSDECSVERGSGKRRSWVWRRASQRFDKDKVQPSNKSKDLRCIVFAMICNRELSDLIVMRRDTSTYAQGYTAESYIEAL
jgi:transposase